MAFLKHFSGLSNVNYSQEPITRSLQLPHIPVTTFSQTDLFLGWIYAQFRSPQEPAKGFKPISVDVDYIHKFKQIGTSG